MQAQPDPETQSADVIKPVTEQETVADTDETTETAAPDESDESDESETENASAATDDADER